MNYFASDNGWPSGYYQERNAAEEVSVAFLCFWALRFPPSGSAIGLAILRFSGRKYRAPTGALQSFQPRRKFGEVSLTPTPIWEDLYPATRKPRVAGARLG